jgi:ATP-dependent DNA helicase RecQ
VVFITSKSDLSEFELQHPALEPFIKGLLRSYEGIFDYPAIMYESRLSKFLNSSMEKVKAALTALHNYGVIKYEPQKDTPQILLLQNRMYSDDFKIDHKVHVSRQEAYRKRITAMSDYISNTQMCRSIQIGSYFGDDQKVPCMICDNCLAKNNIHLSESEFAGISAGILKELKAEKLHINTIESRLKTTNKSKLWKVMDFLHAEKKIVTDKEGFVYLNKGEA